MEYIVDLHVHSRFSRATSRSMTLQENAKFAAQKGIQILGTGDFTHPKWLSEMRRDLKRQEDGFYHLKNSLILFVPTSEVSCIYSQNKKTRRIHLILVAPTLEAVEKLDKDFEKKGFNIRSDGRPIFGASAKTILEMALPYGILVIPAHIWTPWFSLYGSYSGFNSMEECFGNLSSEIYAIETGLSSDPEMNWTVSDLNNRMILSNSDAHSPANLGREANVFDFENPTLNNLFQSIKQNKNLSSTIEFYPEEGKYHFNGHRDCKISLDPEKTKQLNKICPKCHLPLTVGVLHRVEELRDQKPNPQGRVPFRKIVPLEQIIAEALDLGPKTKGVQREYNQIIKQHPEFHILLHAELKNLETLPEIREGIRRVRAGEIYIEPGYDGVYGKVQVFKPEEKKRISQTSLF